MFPIGALIGSTQPGLEVIADFKSVIGLPVGYVCAMLRRPEVRRLAIVATPYMQEFMQRFYVWHSRIALPDEPRGALPLRLARRSLPLARCWLARGAPDVYIPHGSSDQQDDGCRGQFLIGSRSHRALLNDSGAGGRRPAIAGSVSRAKRVKAPDPLDSAGLTVLCYDVIVCRPRGFVAV